MPPTPAELRDFCERWLATWTGNRPQDLLSFYAPQARYRDPARPRGIEGHEALRQYFTRLLAVNPAWRWTVVEVFPTPGGCCLKWQAEIPTGDATVVEQGLDVVELAPGGDHGWQITRNEVYFDRSALLAAARAVSSTV